VLAALRVAPPNPDRILQPALWSEASTHTLSRAEISSLFHRGKTARQLDVICEALLATGLVQHDLDRSGNGRPAHIYSLIEETK
jgi:predicted transcriptional regulator